MPNGFAKEHGVILEDALESMRSVFASPIQRINRTLIGIERDSRGLGQPVLINRLSLGYAEDTQALRFVFDALEEAGHIKREWLAGGGFSACLTAKGYNRIAELQSERRGMDSDQAFVAMWIDHSMDAAFKDGIVPAITEAGYSPKRIDQNVTLGKICDEVIAEIRRSRFMIADVTKQRQSVYFEAGFAMGMGLPVIWTVQKDDIGNLHFDTRQYRHIDWEDPDDLCSRLKLFIEANIPKPAKRQK